MSKETFDPTRYNHSANEPFSSVLEKKLSRRDVLKGGAAFAALGLFSSFGLAGCNSSSSSDNEASESLSLGFKSIAGSKTDAVVVPLGYSAQVLAPWGTPLNSIASEWKSDGTNTALDQANSLGMHHDGMQFFPLDGSSTDGLLCINHEYIDSNALHYDGAARDSEFVRKEINAHGVTVVRVQLTDNGWQVVKDDAHNRRFTAATEMDISGPLAMTAALITPFSTAGNKTRGTLNNCGNGSTPWGTYLTCEENWPGYFVADEATMTEDQKRIGISSLTSGRYNWHDQAGSADEVQGEFSRFNLTPNGANALEDYRNEANGYGYIVEIDPYNPDSTAVKRTALGRFRHEGCAYGKLEAGKPIVFYSGHDSRFEYLYKFESTAMWDPADADRTDRLAVGAKYMDSGTLYVARFDGDGKGMWLPLVLTTPSADGSETLANSFSSQADIILNTAGAADIVGATPMDRPEWTAVDPVTGTVYLTLTNNTQRTDTTNPANPRLNNAFGHIIRWDEVEGSNEFDWDIFVFGSPEDADAETNLSGLDEFNQFASPDGMAFDARGIMWVQTDNGADEVTSYTNDQMLAVVPSKLVDADGNQEVLSASNQAELRRFFVGPNNCEVTGLSLTPDQKNFFVNIQHPGNWPYSTNAAEETPEGTSVRPRASTVVIMKDDNGEIGV
ncbi:PhoX family phosphatase [uncultured Cocleimonas sp.]|uniref:PhoX family protein n=1 Tax=uncultured Cocleimonas sp. TaxID=1051587 RepID=UPI00262D31F9|nr:PhoX family phosphatase [uncultured Cocleimonas sp.]